MRRKSGVKVYVSRERKKLLERICSSLGMDESAVMCQAFMEYAKSILITERVHGKL